MATISLADALFTKTQQRVLGLLYGRSDRSFYTNEIVRQANMGTGTVRRELDRLAQAGLLQASKTGNQLHYQANPKCPIYDELLSIIKKTFGLVEILRSTLVPLADNIDWAFVYGSMASGKERAGSDVDLLVIGHPNFADLAVAIYGAQQSLSREVNFQVFRPEEWLQRLEDKNAFAMELMEKPRLDVMGDRDVIGKFAGNITGKD